MRRERGKAREMREREEGGNSTLFCGG